jgi:hypothetical protein
MSSILPQIYIFGCILLHWQAYLCGKTLSRPHKGVILAAIKIAAQQGAIKCIWFGGIQERKILPKKGLGNFVLNTYTSGYCHDLLSEHEDVCF